MIPRPQCAANFLLTLILVAADTATAHSDETGKSPEKMSGWQRLFREQAAEYKFAVEGHDGGDVELVSEPVLHWSQPVRGGADGAVFVWTQAGQPVAIGTFFIWPRSETVSGVAHEMHSLAQSPLIVTWRDRRWTPPKDSIVWSAVPGAPAPAATPEQRLRQMRDLARTVSAESHDKDDHKWDLRLLPRPVYRFDLDPNRKKPGDERDVLDGALFGFVEGTDLEIVLSIRAAKTDSGLRWEFALARMSDYRLVVRHGDTIVWQVDRNQSYDNPRAAYICPTVEDRVAPDGERP